MGRRPKVRSLLKRMPQWGVPLDCQGGRLLSLLRPLFSRPYESKFLADAECYAHVDDVWSVHRVDLLMSHLKRWRAKSVVRAEVSVKDGDIECLVSPEIEVGFCRIFGPSVFRLPLALLISPLVVCLRVLPPGRFRIVLLRWRILRRSCSDFEWGASGGSALCCCFCELS